MGRRVIHGREKKGYEQIDREKNKCFNGMSRKKREGPLTSLFYIQRKPLKALNIHILALKE
jgi:hypothetical protein